MSQKDKIDVALAIVGIGGALVVFVVGLVQYWGAQRWKRVEFVAQEAKEFFTNPKVAVALTLIDWGGRTVNLDPTGPGFTRYVTRQMQAAALLPHPLMGTLASDAEVAEDTDDSGFTARQGHIRDCYDALLDGFERFGSHVTSGLVEPRQIRPYLGSWIDDISAPARSDDDALWCACLLAYISFYRFEGVIGLFDRFDKDIRFDGPIAKGFLEKVEASPQPGAAQFVATLRVVVEQELAIQKALH